MWRDGEGNRVPAQITGFEAFAGAKGASPENIGPLRGEVPGKGGLPEPTAIRPAQELEAIEARANPLTTPREEACRSSERVNSIRRSKALERMNGKRWNTRSRMSR
jgi:hypothetical protein